MTKVNPWTYVGEKYPKSKPCVKVVMPVGQDSSCKWHMEVVYLVSGRTKVIRLDNLEKSKFDKRQFAGDNQVQKPKRSSNSLIGTRVKDMYVIRRLGIDYKNNPIFLVVWVDKYNNYIGEPFPRRMDEITEEKCTWHGGRRTHSNKGVLNSFIPVEDGRMGKKLYIIDITGDEVEFDSIPEIACLLGMREEGYIAFRNTTSFIFEDGRSYTRDLTVIDPITGKVKGIEVKDVIRLPTLNPEGYNLQMRQIALLNTMEGFETEVMPEKQVMAKYGHLLGTVHIYKK